MLQLGLANTPFMGLAAGRARGTNKLAANSQQGFKLALDADVDISTGVRADKVQTFHDGPPAVGGGRGLVLLLARKQGHKSTDCDAGYHRSVRGLQYRFRAVRLPKRALFGQFRPTWPGSADQSLQQRRQDTGANI